MANVEFKIYSKRTPINVNVRFYHNKIDVSSKSNIFIDMGDYKYKRIAVGKKSDSTIIIINEEIKKKTSELQRRILEQFKIDYPKNNPINSRWLKRIINDFHERADDQDDVRFFFTPFIAHYIENAKSQINPITGRLLDKKTITRYKYTLNKILEFQNYVGEKIRTEDVNLEFHNEFIHYLLEVCEPYGAETIKKFIGQIRQFVRAAQTKGYKTSPEIDSPKFSFKSGETIDTFLNEDEIQAIFRLDLSANSRLDDVRDLFITGLRTGLRISDLKRVNSFEISNDRIKIAETAKTNSYIEIPLHPELKYILRKRAGILPEISEQRFNEYVKELCKLAQIDDIILGSLKIAETKRKVIGYYPKYLLIASHTCRRSFVTNLYGKLPDLTIMAITGHKKHSQFLDYVKTTNREHIERLEEHWNKEIK